MGWGVVRMKHARPRTVALKPPSQQASRQRTARSTAGVPPFAAPALTPRLLPSVEGSRAAMLADTAAAVVWSGRSLFSSPRKWAGRSLKPWLL